MILSRCYYNSSRKRLSDKKIEKIIIKGNKNKTQNQESNLWNNFPFPQFSSSFFLGDLNQEQLFNFDLIALQVYFISYFGRRLLSFHWGWGSFKENILAYGYKRKFQTLAAVSCSPTGPRLGGAACSLFCCTNYFIRSQTKSLSR